MYHVLKQCGNLGFQPVANKVNGELTPFYMELSIHVICIGILKKEELLRLTRLLWPFKVSLFLIFIIITYIVMNSLPVCHNCCCSVQVFLNENESEFMKT